MLLIQYNLHYKQNDIQSQYIFLSRCVFIKDSICLGVINTQASLNDCRPAIIFKTGNNGTLTEKVRVKIEKV